MTDGKCPCGGGKAEEVCQVCGAGEKLPYWCDACGQAVADKRCPLCGLKARKIREGK